MPRGWLLVCTVIAGCSVLLPRTATAAEPKERTVTVSAMAEVKVVPDQVVLTLGIATRDPKYLAAAKADNDRRTRAVLAVAEKYHIPAAQIQISSLTMGPVYERGSLSTSQYYRVTRRLEIVLTDFETLPPILGDALAAGVTEISDLLFCSTKNAEHQVEARRKAVQYAKVKAAHLAELNGLKLGKALKIEEDVESNQHTTGSGMGMGGFMSPFGSTSNRTPKPSATIYLTADGPKSSRDARAKTDDASEGQLLPPGVIVIDATVTITFEMVE